MKTSTKVITLASLIAIIALAAFIFVKFFFVFGDGVKAGELNQVMHKGYVFKTYEGRLILSGFKGAKSGNGIQSNEFNFSVVDPEVADSLMRCSGKVVEVHYKEYLGALPWRGMEECVVDKILSVREAEKTTVVPIGGEE